MTMQPTRLNGCAAAATAAEARFRIDRVVDLVRSTRVIALDDAAATIVREVAKRSWSDAHFLTLEPGSQHVSETTVVDAPLIDESRGPTRLSHELEGADWVVMVATTGDTPEVARTIGEAAALRNVMTAGVVFGEQAEVRGAVAALRPFARVLLISRDAEDVAEILTALRA